MKSLKTNLSFTQDLASSALSYTTTFTQAFRLGMITLHASVAITESIVITLDSNKGANYDTVLRSVDLSGETDFSFNAEGDILLQPGDAIKVTCTNANLTGVVYGEIKALEIG